MVEASRLSGIVEILGTDKSVAELNRVARAFDTAIAASIGLKQIGQSTAALSTQLSGADPFKPLATSAQNARRNVKTAVDQTIADAERVAAQIERLSKVQIGGIRAPARPQMAATPDSGGINFTAASASARVYTTEIEHISAATRALNSALDPAEQHEQQLSIARATHAERIHLLTTALGQLQRATAAESQTEEQRIALLKRTQATELELAREETALSRSRSTQASGGGSSIGQVIGSVAAAAGAYQLATATARLASEGNALIVSLNAERQTVEALFGSVAQGDRVFAEAVAWGEKYRYTQAQMGEAAQAASLLIRDGTSSVAETFDVLARLQAKAPGKSFEDAVRAVTELQAGQFQSLERIFNIPAAAVQGLSDKIKAGEDPIRSLSALLNQMGITSDILKTRLEGAAGAQNSLNQAVEGLKIGLGDLVQSSGWTQFLAFLANTASGVVGGKGVISTAQDQARADVAAIVASSNTIIEVRQRVAAKEAEIDQQRMAARERGDGAEALRLAALRGAYNEQKIPVDDLALSLKQADQARTESISGYRESNEAINNAAQATAKEAAETARLKAQYDAMGTSLATITDRELRPYKAAVDAATDALKQHQAAVKADKDVVDSISGALTAARARYQEFAQAQLVGTKAYADQQFALDQQQARIRRDMLQFQAPGAGLDQLLAPIQSQIEGADQALKGYASDLDEINSFVDEQTRVVAAATAQQKEYDDAVGLAKDNLSQQQSRLESLKGVYDDLNASLTEQKRRMDDIRHTPLQGEGALSDKLFAIEENIKRAQLRLALAEQRGAGKGEIKALEDTLARLRRQQEIAQLQGDLATDADKRRIAQAGVPRNEKTAAEILAEITQQQQAIDQTTASAANAKTAMDAQAATVASAKWDLMEASAVQRDHTAAVDAEKATLEGLKVSQAEISKQYQDQKTLLAELKTQLDTTRNDALKPFQDQIDELGRRAEVLKLDEKLELGPLRKSIDDTVTKTKELTFAEIITGLGNTNALIALLEPRLASAANILKQEEAATAAAQTTVNVTTAALTAEQKYFDALKTGLDDMKTKLQESKDIWGDLSTLIAAINAANTAGGMPGMRAPFTPGGSGGYSAQAIDTVLAQNGSPLAGQGQFIIDMSLKYGIPVEVALSMWKIESAYGTTGAGVRNKNPGNLRLSPLETSHIGDFSQFASWQTGMEAFFKQLREGTQFGYPQAVDRYKGGDITALLDLIAKYAPAGDNNDPAAYYQGVKDMIAQLLQLIRGGGGAPSRTGIINNANPADDPRPSQAAVTQLFGSGATIGDTYDALREGTTGRHYGVDIIMAPGTKLLSPVAGTVIKAGLGSKGFQGGVVMINDTLGREWYFGHVHYIQVREGQMVVKGTLLAYIGEEAHTHVQVREGGVQLPVDPSAAIDYAAAQPSGAGDYFPQGMDIGGPSFPVLAGQASAQRTAVRTRTIPAGMGYADTAGLWAYLKAMHVIDAAAYTTAMGMDAVGAGMSIAGPNMDTLAGQIAGVGDAAATTADQIVNATDDILDHVRLIGKTMPDLGYSGTGGGLPGFKGPHDPFSYGGAGRQANDPHWGEPITKTAAAAQDAAKTMQDVVVPWQTSWDQLATTATGAMEDTVVAVQDGIERVLRNIHRGMDELKTLVDTAKSLSTLPGGSGGGNGGGGSGGGNGGVGDITFNVLDKNGVGRKLRKMGY